MNTLGDLARLRSLRAEWNAMRTNGLVEYLRLRSEPRPMELPIPSHEHTKIDTALQTLIPIGTFGAAVSFSALFSAGFSQSDNRTKSCIAAAFALYLCSAVVNLTYRLSFTIDPKGETGLLSLESRRIAFLFGLLPTIAATMLVALSLTFNFQYSGVRAAGSVAAFIVGYSGMVTIMHAVAYSARDYRFILSAVLQERRAAATASSCLQFQPPGCLGDEIRRYLELNAKYGKAFAHLSADSASISATLGNSFTQLSREEQSRRLAYAAMAFNGAVPLLEDSRVAERILDEAREFLAESMRKWDTILQTLISEEKGEDNWWQLSQLRQVPRMWWLFEAEGGHEMYSGTTTTAAEAGAEDAAVVGEVTHQEEYADISAGQPEDDAPNNVAGIITAALRRSSSGVTVDLEAQIQRSSNP